MPQVVIVAGTGRKVGKTTVAADIIRRFSNHGVYSVKISSHNHPLQDGLEVLFREEDFVVSEELSARREKDSSRLLAAGAIKSFYIQVVSGGPLAPFKKVMSLIPGKSPVVCESPSLATSVIPGALIVVSRLNNVSGGEKRLTLPLTENRYDISSDRVESGEVIPLAYNKGLFHIAR